MSSRIATAPMGWAALVNALAMVIMSGVTPKLCAAKALPVRPKPQITSSKTKRISFSSQISRSRSRYPLGGTRIPVDPAMGSMKQAAMVCPPTSSTMRCRSSASSAPFSGWPLMNRFSGSQVWRMCTTPGIMAPKASRFFMMPLNEVPPTLTP